MNKGYLWIAAVAGLLSLAGNADASLLRSGAYYESDVTTESGGFRCGSFHTGAAAVSECAAAAFYMDSGSGTFYQVDYSSKGSATYGTLKTSSSLTFTPGVPDPNPPVIMDGAGAAVGVDVRPLPAHASAYGSASFRDTWTVTGGAAGTAGTLRLGYALDGSSSSPFANGVAVGSSTTLRIAELEMITLPGGTILIQVKQAGTIYNSGFNGAVNEVVVLELGIVFGQQFIVDVLMNSLSSFDFFTASTPGFTTSSDFFNTAMLDNIQVLDASGAPLPFTLMTESGSPVFGQFSTPAGGGRVPLPPTLALLLLGLAAGWCRRLAATRRRQ